MKRQSSLGSLSRSKVSNETHLPRASEAEAEAAARELWSGWNQMDDEERRVLLLEVHRALAAVVACRASPNPK
jgi:hypothetical protein